MTVPNMATRTVEWSPTTGALATPTWVDISAYVQSIDIKGGRQHELNRIEATTCRIVLNNQDRRFDPNYAAGAYYPNVLPMKQVRVRATWNGTTYDLFRGYIESWSPIWRDAHDASTEVMAVDGMKLLNNAQLKSVWEIEVPTDSPIHSYRLADVVGSAWVVDEQGGDRGVIYGAVTLGSSGLIAHDAATSASFGGGYVDIPKTSWPTTTAYSFGVWITASPNATDPIGNTRYLMDWSSSAGTASLGNRNYVNMCLYTPALGSLNITCGWLNYVGAGGGYLSGTFPFDSKPHYVLASLTSSGTSRLFVDGVQVASQASTTTFLPDGVMWLGGSPDVSSPFNLPHNGQMQDFRIYSTALSAARALALYQAGATPWTGDKAGTRIGRYADQAGWPAGLRAIDTGQTTVTDAGTQGKSAGTLMQEATLAEYGTLFIDGTGTLTMLGRYTLLKTPYITSQATFGDGAGELAYRLGQMKPSLDDTNVVNDARNAREGGTVQVATDATSQTTYGQRTHSSTGLQVSGTQPDTEMLGRSQWEVAHYKDATERVPAITVNPFRDPTNLWPQVLGRKVKDRITVKRRPPGSATANTYTVLIEGFHHSIGLDTWSTTWDLSPADTQPYFVWDTSTWNSGTNPTRWAY